MPLLGPAAMLLSFDVDRDAEGEHDDWHTHEHLAERLGIPGFLRGSRWIALGDAPRYLVVYEVASLETLKSDAYLERLNNPSPWTTQMMTRYRGMRRGFCAVTASFGVGLGNVATLLRFKPAPQAADALRHWLAVNALPSLPAQRGLGSVHLLEGAATPAMTNEQRIRGADAGVDWALIITAYERSALGLLARLLNPAVLAEQGAPGGTMAEYRLDYVVTREDVAILPRP